MGKERVIAETGAGQHGVASATAAALLGLECEVYMGAVDVERQALNVFRMKLLGARVIPVESGSKTLKDAVNEALRDWVTNVRTTYYLLGSVMGPHPVPDDGARLPPGDRRGGARAGPPGAPAACPDLLVACVGGGSNAIGLFWPFIGDRRVRIVGVEPGGHGIKSGKHGASLGSGAVGRAARQHELRAPERRRAGRRGALDLGRPRLSRASGPSTPTTRTPAASSTSRSPTTRRSRASRPSRGSRASCPRSSPRTRWPTRCGPPRG